MLSFHAREAVETEQLASVIGEVIGSRSLASRQGSRAVVIALSGELGAGKTAFARGLARGFGVEHSQVSSPTFTLRMDHFAARGERVDLFAHLDCWRMETGALESVGWDALLEEPNALVVIEWPQRIAASLPKLRLDVTIRDGVGEGSLEQSQSRRVDIDCTPLANFDPSLAARMIDALLVLAQAVRVSHPGCARCGGALQNDAFAPFCTARCRLLDLGAWLRGAYVIEGAEGSPESESGEIA